MLVNAASYRINLDVMRACLAAGCHYIDLGGLYWLTGQAARAARRVRASRASLAVLGIGSRPGKTNVMALEAVRASSTRRCRRWTWPPPGATPTRRPGLSLPYALRTLLDELIDAADGGARRRAGGARAARPPAATVDFGPPIGEADTIYTLHSELRTFPDSFGCSEASFRLSLAPGLVERLTELIDCAGRRGRARAAAGQPGLAQDLLACTVAEADRRATAAACGCPASPRPHEGWRLGGGVVSTASPAAAAVRLLARGKIERRGALRPSAASSRRTCSPS